MAWTRYRVRSAVSGLLATGTVLAAMGAGAQAATITVNGTCSLPQAVSAVNTRARVGGCAAGTGNDVIVVPAGSTITLNSSLTVTRTVTIQTGTAKKKALIVPANTSVQPALFNISPLTGTAASVTFTDITMIGNPSTRGINATGHNNTDKLTLNRCIFSFFGQSAVGTTETSVTVTDSYFHQNDSQLGGGLRMEGNGNNNVMTVSTSSFLNNTASDSGGAIYHVAPGHSVITNSTFSQNSADFGGAFGLFGFGAIYDFNGATIANNFAGGGGGGGSSSSTVNFTTTLIAANNINQNPGLPSDWDFNSSITSLRDSLLGSSFSVDAFGGGGTIPIDSIGVNSILDVPSDFGQVVGIDAFDLGGDQIDSPPTLSPNPSGPAVDAMPSVLSTLTIDQRGFPRGVDVPGGNGSNRFDIGAVEHDVNVQAETLVSTTTNNGTLSPVSSIAGFLPTLGGTTGKGLKFVPNAVGSSVSFRLPMANGGGAQTITLHVQSCPTCGTYRVQLQDDADVVPSFVTIGTQSTSSSTTKVVTLPAMSIAPFDPSGFGEDDVIDIKFTLTSKPANSNGQLVLDFIKF